MSTARKAARTEAVAGAGDDWQVRRVVVALDASPASAAAAQTAARMAARLSAELLGLFVEDAALLRLASLPGCVVVGSFSATTRPLPHAEIARRLRAQAGRARRLLEASALDAAVRSHRFEVRQGEVPGTLADAIDDADLLSLGRVGTTGLARLGSVARAAIGAGRGNLLLLPAGGRVDAPVTAVFESSPGARRALRAALRLLGSRGTVDPAPGPGSLTLLVVAGDAEEAGRLASEARALIASTGTSPAVARLRHAHPGDRHALALTVAASRANVLFLPAESSLVRPEDLAAVVESLDCSVLVVR